ncbi:hypothetical protein I8751_26230 [Nostocaceae cyanobacterium CENA357]|uniref:Uncharacterized protein n=1 Tax=Atlanticothrix silvestris CENA357 TaxID=1725252 RepID=A0A8J7HIN6_9CYAN|nr:hypothetical protein [Atlanticothrix silvestris]MBH8555781.1 hypothetical protein [Atlanticothrix silvestris CENA357]
MTQANLLQLAKQGDAQAIAFLMNRHLQSKGITAKVILEDGCLQVMLESAQVPNQQALVAFVHRGISSLGAASIEKVQVYWQQTGEDFPTWSQEFDLDISESELELLDNEQDSTTPQILTVSITLSGDNTCGLTSKIFETIANKMTKDILSLCTDVFVQKVVISNGSSMISRER